MQVLGPPSMGGCAFRARYTGKELVMSRYAENTKVPVDRSRAEIERTLERYGADAFAYATTADRAMVEFSAHNRRVRFLLPLPDASECRLPALHGAALGTHGGR